MPQSRKVPVWGEYTLTAEKSVAGGSGKPISRSLLRLGLIAVDGLALLGAAAIAYAVWLSGEYYAVGGLHALAAMTGTLIAVVVFNKVGLYGMDAVRAPWRAVPRIAASWFAVQGFLLALAYLTKTSSEFSRGWALLWMCGGLVALIAWRAAFGQLMRHWISEGRLRRHVAIFGDSSLAERLAARFSGDPDSGVRVIGLFSDDAALPPLGALRRTGGLDEIVRLAQDDRLDLVILALSPDDEKLEAKAMNRLRDVPVDVHVCPGASTLRHLHRPACEVGGVTMLQVADSPLADWRRMVKDAEDRILGTLILLLIAPVMLLIALAIKLDSRGPVFFRQIRYGYNNRTIEVLKFRSMRVDLADANAETLTSRNDPRVTRIGAFLRRTSLDELPQFINVARGEMSIVGPRPHALSAKAAGLLYQNSVPCYAARHTVKPGITGWAQVNGWRGTTDTLTQIEKRVEHDLFYIRNWSLSLDLKIIFLTMFKGFWSSNAY